LLAYSRDFDLSSKKKNDFLVSKDMHEDAVIIIDAVGTILMTSQVCVCAFVHVRAYFILLFLPFCSALRK
jgi:hypothetical protein